MRRMIVGLLALSILPACRSGSPGRPPDGYVITPFGFVHRSCVRLIASGERVSGTGVITGADGQQEQLPPCQYARLSRHTMQPAGKSSRDINGWVEAAQWNSPVALGTLGANWTVPPAPTVTGATVFFFPGSQPGDGSSILQPVLQFGSSAAGGGNFWSAASWFCCPAGWTHHSSLITVNAGDTMSGGMNATCGALDTCNWDIGTLDLTTGAGTMLEADAVDPSFVEQFGGVLEAYNLTTCANYPPNGTITFFNITLQDQSGNTLTPNWSNFTTGDSPSCSYSVSASGSSVTLTY